MRKPKIVLDSEQLALAAATYVRDYMGVKMQSHYTTLKFDPDNKFSAEVIPSDERMPD